MELPRLGHGRMCTWPCGRLVADPLLRGSGVPMETRSQWISGLKLSYVCISLDVFVKHVSSHTEQKRTSAGSWAAEGSTSWSEWISLPLFTKVGGKC